MYYVPSQPASYIVFVGVVRYSMEIWAPYLYSASNVAIGREFIFVFKIQRRKSKDTHSLLWHGEGVRHSWKETKVITYSYNVRTCVFKNPNRTRKTSWKYVWSCKTEFSLLSFHHLSFGHLAAAWAAAFLSRRRDQPFSSWIGTGRPAANSGNSCYIINRLEFTAQKRRWNDMKKMEKTRTKKRRRLSCW